MGTHSHTQVIIGDAPGKRIQNCYKEITIVEDERLSQIFSIFLGCSSHPCECRAEIIVLHEKSSSINIFRVLLPDGQIHIPQFVNNGSILDG